MKKKLLLLIFIILLTILSTLFFLETISIDRALLENTFIVDAIYNEENNLVEIYFLDKSGKTQSVVLEILGMSTSFQKNFFGSEFTEKVPFSSIPQYGWKTNPVTLVITHEEFGTIGIKTEIHASNDPRPSIIFSKL